MLSLRRNHVPGTELDTHAPKLSNQPYINLPTPNNPSPLRTFSMPARLRHMVIKKHLICIINYTQR